MKDYQATALAARATVRDVLRRAEYRHAALPARAAVRAILER